MIDNVEKVYNCKKLHNCIEDGGSMFLQNTRKQPSDNMASHPRRHYSPFPTSSFLLGLNIFLSILFPNIFIECPPPPKHKHMHAKA
jgi:hypothetical protein